VQPSNEVLAERRARWLAKVSVALSEARRLLRDLDVPDRAEAVTLCAQIEALSREVEALRLKRNSRESPDFHPEWMDSPWHPLERPDLPRQLPRSTGTGWGLPADA
jgi:hypothetical protein